MCRQTPDCTLATALCSATLKPSERYSTTLNALPIASDRVRASSDRCGWSSACRDARRRACCVPSGSAPTHIGRAVCSMPNGRPRRLHWVSRHAFLRCASACRAMTFAALLLSPGFQKRQRPRWRTSGFQIGIGFQRALSNLSVIETQSGLHVGSRSPSKRALNSFAVMNQTTAAATNQRKTNRKDQIAGHLRMVAITPASDKLQEYSKASVVGKRTLNARSSCRFVTLF